MEKKILAFILCTLMLAVSASGCLGGEEKTKDIETTIDPDNNTDPPTPPDNNTDPPTPPDNGDPDCGKEYPPQTITNSITDKAWVQSFESATSDDVRVRHIVSLEIPHEKIVYISSIITILDGCGDREYENEDTQPDIINGEKITGGDEIEQRIPGGEETPVTVTADFKSNGGYLPSNWEIHLDVTIRSSEDNWPGPLTWYGVPDEGFCYEITLEYTYMAE